MAQFVPVEETINLLESATIEQPVSPEVIANGFFSAENKRVNTYNELSNMIEEGILDLSVFGGAPFNLSFIKGRYQRVKSEVNCVVELETTQLLPANNQLVFQMRYFPFYIEDRISCDVANLASSIPNSAPFITSFKADELSMFFIFQSNTIIPANSQITIGINYKLFF